MANNTFGFLLSVLELFDEVHLPVWIFGGWAEELWQLTPARIHTDIDFLYPAAMFESLDRFMTRTKEFQVIQAKRFSHKRAILYQHVLIEFLLVQGSDGNHFTDFFSGRYYLAWPADIFCYKANPRRNFQIASPQALAQYRQHHEKVEQAYQDFLTSC